jgi:hypothetical protein
MPRGSPRIAQSLVMRDVREKIDGLPEGFSFHDRHYLASLLIASGADIKTVQGANAPRNRTHNPRHQRPFVARCRRVHPLGDRCRDR